MIDTGVGEGRRAGKGVSHLPCTIVSYTYTQLTSL
jgi:hypothetical protein